MVLPGGLAVLALLPAVAVAAVAHLLARVQQHAPALRPAAAEEGKRICSSVLAPQERNRKRPSTMTECFH